MSATEACYRLFAFELHANLPHVIRLALHLEDQQPLVFAENAAIEDVLSRQRHTTLTGWFVANRKFASARDLTYTNFPINLCGMTDREWKERVKGHGTVIGRVYSAHPGESDRYFLRMLLNHVTGCTSYQEIRTLSDGTVCDTFKEAALRRGLLEDNQESDDCLTAAVISEVPAQLRQLFVTILLFNEPSDPLTLWNKHKVSLSEDYLFKARVLAPNLELNEYLTNKALKDIQYRQEQQGKSLSDFPGMPLPSFAKSPNINLASFDMKWIIM